MVRIFTEGIAIVVSISGGVVDVEMIQGARRAVASELSDIDLASDTGLSQQRIKLQWSPITFRTQSAPRLTTAPRMKSRAS